MKQSRKGFTLLELLAVIVILAIIALIAVPIVLNVIENARKGSATNSAYGYIDALEYTNSRPNLTESNTLEDGVYDVLNLDVDVNGTKPTYGEVTIKKGVVQSGEICINGYEVVYEKGKAKAVGTCNTERDTTAPTLILEKEIITTDSIVIPFKAEDKESGIKSVICNYGIEELNKQGIVEDNVCKLTDLTPGLTYNVQVIAVNKTNLVTTKPSGNKTLKITTGEVNMGFNIVNIPEDTEYAQEKHITVTYDVSNLTKKAYYFKSTVDVESDIEGYNCGDAVDPGNCSEDSTKSYKKDIWYKVKVNPTIKMLENGSLYAKVHDGSEYLKAETLTITTIDTGAPSLRVDTLKITTNSIEIPFTAIDSESGISKTTCVYGESKDYGINGTVENIESGPCKLENIKQGTKYYYKLTTIDKSGRKAVVEGDSETKVIKAPTWSLDETGWSVRKKATVTFSGENIKEPVYFVKTTEKVTIDVDAKACTGNLPKTASECTGTSTKILDKDTWYMVESSANLEVTENGSLYAYTSDGNNIASSSVLTITTIDKEPPALKLGTVIASSNSISVPFEVSDYTKVSVSCVYGETESYGQTGTVIYEKNEEKEKTGSCRINNIKDDKTYYYKVVAEDLAGTKTTKSGSTKTSAIIAPTWEVDNTGWTTSKVATVTFTGTGITSPMYYVKATVDAKVKTGKVTYECGDKTTPELCTTTSVTEIEKDHWYRVEGTTSITLDENGSLYAMVSDGVNTKSSSVLTITTIDKTEPVITKELIETVRTDRVSLQMACSDESGITKYEFSKDGGATWTSNGTSGNYTFTGLSQATIYNFEGRCTNGSGLKSTSKKQAQTATIALPVWSIPTGWAQSKVATITFSSSNIENPGHFIKLTMSAELASTLTDGNSNATLVACSVASNSTPTANSACTGTVISANGVINANTWYKVTGKLSAALKLTQNGSLYAITSDGLNYNAANTLTVTTIDTSAPTCTNSGDSTTWTNENRTIYFGCSDNGSECDSAYSGGTRIFNQTTQTATIEEYIIKDKAGNTTTCPARTANVYVDKQAPTCTNRGDSTNWTKDNRSIYYGCDDANSTCDGSYSGGVMTYTQTTQTATIAAYTIKDKAGNTTNCPARTANVYVDKTPPTCTNSGDSTSWTSGSRIIYYGCSDSNSTCDVAYSGGNQTFTSTTTQADIPAYTIKDYAGNSTSCPARKANVYVDKTNPTISTAFAVSTKTNNATVSMTCTDTSGIKEYLFSKDNGATWTSAGTSTSYTFSGLTQTTTYKFAGKCVDKAANATTSSKEAATPTIVVPTISVPSGWAQSKVATITFNAQNVTSPQYYIKSNVATTITGGSKSHKCGTGDTPTGCTAETTAALAANTWYRVSTTEVKLTLTANANLYAIIGDGTNTKTASTTLTGIDRTPPTCTNSGDSTSWTAGNRTITWGCSDGTGQSGCNASYSGSSTTYSSGTVKQATIAAYTIKDNAGNQTNCPARTANVYVDKEAPTCTNSGDSTSWTNGSRTISWGGSDPNSGSGIASGAGSTTYNTANTTVKTASIAAYTLKDGAGNTTNCPARTANVYVDKQAPTCTNSGDSTSWTNGSRTISWGGTDPNSGSGIASGTGSTTYNTANTTVKTASIAAYTIKDGAGNSTSCAARTANVYVDKQAPTCTNSGDSTSWTASGRTIYWGGSDPNSGSGLASGSGSVTYNTAGQTVKQATIAAYTIKDAVGNTTSCAARTANVYVDKQGPTCTNSGDSTSWTSGNRSIYYSGSDAGYGSVSGGGTMTYSTGTTKQATIAAYTVKDGLGNSTSCAARTANVYVDKTAPTCTNSGDSTSWTSGNRVLYYGCSDGGSGCASGYTGGSTTISWTASTTSVGAYTIKDNVGWTTSCPARTANAYVDKTAPSCTSSGDSTSWTAGNRVIYWGCSDSQSGCNSSYAGGSTTVNWTAAQASIGAYTIKDWAGNTTSCAARTANVYVDKTAPSCTSSGDSTSWTAGNRVIYWGCSDSQSGCNSSYAGGSTTVNWTAAQASIGAYTIKDWAGNTTSCPARTANVYVDKTAPTLSVAGYKTTTKSEASGYTATTAYTSNTWYTGWVWVNGSAIDYQNSVTLYYTRTPDGTYGGSGAQNKTATAAANAWANTKNYSDAIGISYYKYYACDAVGNCAYSSASPYTFTVKLDRQSGNFGKYHCTYKCASSCDSYYHATNSSNACYTDSSGQSGNVMIKVSFDQSTNKLSYYVRQGGDTKVGTGYGIYIKNGSTVLATVKPTTEGMSAGKDWSGSVTLSAGLYTDIWVDGDTVSSPYYDLKLGKLIVT